MSAAPTTAWSLSELGWSERFAQAFEPLARPNVIPGRVTLEHKHIYRVFTEHGALMAANVLNSKRAMEMSVFVVRAFTKMRAALSDTRELARKLATLECEVKSRLDSHDAAIVEVMQRILDLIDPPEHPAPPPPPRKIGFSVKESPAKYAARRRIRSSR